tara:strand:+ start:5682 stop:5993 length:312 start_codon:yes stop_codon:yes gene_type:complete
MSLSCAAERFAGFSFTVGALGALGCLAAALLGPAPLLATALLLVPVFFACLQGFDAALEAAASPFLPRDGAVLEAFPPKESAGIGEMGSGPEMCNQSMRFVIS